MRTRDTTAPERRAYPFRAAAGAGDGMRIEGVASMFGSRNSYGEVFVPGAYAESLAGKTDAKPLPIGLYHREVVGRWTDFSEDPQTGLELAGPLSDTQAGRDAATLVRDGALTGLSIGFWPLEETLAEPDEKVTFQTPLGTFSYQFDRWTWYVLKADVLEASLVMVPSDDEARVKRSAAEKAGGALPGLAQDAPWEEAAWSMALLMGARGTGKFADLPEAQHRALYDRVAGAYRRHGRTPPGYERAPIFDEVGFCHKERELFLDRHLQEALKAVSERARAADPGSLSGPAREAAREAADALTTLLKAGGKGADLAEIRHALDLARSHIQTP